MNTCLCELVQCAGQDSAGLYRHIKWGCDFLCDFVDLLNSVYSAHTLILVRIYVVIFIYDSYFKFAGIMDVNRGIVGKVVWVSVTIIETAFNAVAFTVLIYVCSNTTFEVRRCMSYFY
jgi:hypothetical protein